MWIRRITLCHMWYAWFSEQRQNKRLNERTKTKAIKQGTQRVQTPQHYWQLINITCPGEVPVQREAFALPWTFFSLTHLLGWKTHKLRTTKFDLKKLETSLYRTACKVFRCVEPCRRSSRVWQTDRRTGCL